MKVLVLGEGGREHAICWKLSQSQKVEEIFWIKGNGACEEKVTKVDLDYLKDRPGLLKFIKEKNISIVVIGPELPLSEGLTNFLQENKVKVFGPTKEGAQLECDKGWAKKFMHKYNIPTARFNIFPDYESIAKEILKLNAYPVVLKATGLAAGKGVKIVNNDSEAHAFIEDVFVKKKFGVQSGIVLEDYLHGPEVSVFALTDGYNVINLIPVRDHKQLLDGGKGPNTGGMGAISPIPGWTKDLEKQVTKEIILPTVDGLRNEGILYQGVIFAGLILTPSGPKVLEYNCRFGDPETQVIMRLLESDLTDLITATIDGSLDTVNIKWKDEKALCIILASQGYPENYEKGFEIKNIEKAEKKGVKVFHAGTKISEEKTVTNGGRVLAVTGTDKDMENLRKTVYSAIEIIDFNGKYYRKDIGLTENK